MPDENIAEALQRVTVFISRFCMRYDKVRGMGADLNQITVNGQTLTSGSMVGEFTESQRTFISY